MKKLVLFLAFFGAFAFTSNAQSCSKKTASKACCAKTSAAAAKLASNDASIEAKTCSKSGTVSYYKNYTCSVSGKMTSTEVTYDEKTQKFVNVSPSSKEAAVGGKNVKTAKAVKTTKAVKAKKACCSKTAGAKSCSKKVEN